MNEPQDNHAASQAQGSGADPRGVTSLADRVRALQLAKSSPQRERGRFAWLPWALCLVLAGVSTYFGYRAATATPSADSDRQRNVGDGQNRDEPAPGQVALEAGGYIIPVRKVQVSPKVGGQVVELAIEEGMYVRKGFVLAKLERNEYEYDFNRMSALMDQAWAKYVEMVTGFRIEEKGQAEETLKEAKELLAQLKDEAGRLRRSGTATSADELVKIESRVRQAEARVKQLEWSHKMMQEGQRQERIDATWWDYMNTKAERDRAKWRLDNTDVVAPVSGIILTKYAELGNTVRPEAFSNGLSASLCDMADLRNLWVDVDVSERDLNRVFKGQKCRLWTERAPNEIYEGYVELMMPVANRSKASVSVRVRILPPMPLYAASEKVSETASLAAQLAAVPGLALPLAVTPTPHDLFDHDPALRPDMRARVQFLARE